MRRDREVSGHATVLATYGSFRVSAEPTSYVLKTGDPVKVKVTAQDYDGKPVQTAVHIDVNLEKWDSVTHQRTDTPVTGSDAQTGADGTALVDLPMTNSGSGDFAMTPARRRRSGALWRERPGFGSGTVLARITTRTPRRRSLPTRRATRWATRRTCCW